MQSDTWRETAEKRKLILRRCATFAGHLRSMDHGSATQCCATERNRVICGCQCHQGEYNSLVAEAKPSLTRVIWQPLRRRCKEQVVACPLTCARLLVCCSSQGWNCNSNPRTAGIDQPRCINGCLCSCDVEQFRTARIYVFNYRNGDRLSCLCYKRDVKQLPT